MSYTDCRGSNPSPRGWHPCLWNFQMSVIGEDELFWPRGIFQTRDSPVTRLLLRLCQDSCKPSAVDEDPAHLCWMDIFLDYFTFETLVSHVCEGLVFFHFKGKTGHKWLRNFMGLSKAQTGSQGKIKVQLLCGKSNGKERLLPDKREVLPCGSGGIRDLGTPLLVPLRSLAELWTSKRFEGKGKQVFELFGKRVRGVIIFGSKIFVFGSCLL